MPREDAPQTREELIATLQKARRTLGDAIDACVACTKSPAFVAQEGLAGPKDLGTLRAITDGLWSHEVRLLSLLGKIKGGGV